MSFFRSLISFLFGRGKSKPTPAILHQKRLHQNHQPEVKLTKKRYSPTKLRTPSKDEVVTTETPPYKFARKGVFPGTYLDMTTDGSVEILESLGLPILMTPQDLANWLGQPLGRVAWLTYRFTENGRPADVQESHYHYHWLKKRSGGYRLIEAPKVILRAAQTKILAEILEQIATHSASHGFVPGCSIITNASPHVARQIIVKQDLDNFYVRIRFSKVVAIFRSIGYCREVAIWLARLCTSSLPTNLPFPKGSTSSFGIYRANHLPQGAPTSPAIANLAAFSLDVRLAGLAKAFGANYTRYADDLTFSGSDSLQRSLFTFLPLVKQIIKQEKFIGNKKKRKVVRKNQRQYVTGVVVNDKVNCKRSDFDRLKAILHNCIHSGPDSQNRENHPYFREHLRGRIAHIKQLNPNRGLKLLRLFEQINWSSYG